MSTKEKKNADEVIEQIATLESAEEVSALVEGDERTTVQKAAEKRIAELSEPEAKADDEDTDEEQADATAESDAEEADATPGEPVEVPADVFNSVLTAVTHNVNQSKKRRGMSQPTTVERELIAAQEELEQLLK